MIYDVETMTEELTSEKKFSGYIYMFDFFFIIAFAMISYLTQNLVSSQIFIVYLLCNLGIGLFLSRKSHYNPKKRIYQSLKYFIARDRKTYYSIDLEKPDFPVSR